MLFNSGQNLCQKSSELGFCYPNDPQQEELVKETDNAKDSEKAYEKCRKENLAARRIAM